MKRVVSFFLAACASFFLIFSCASGPRQAAPVKEDSPVKSETSFIPGYPEIGTLLKDFELAVRTADRNLLAQLLTPKPTLLHHRRDSRRNEFFGFDAVTEFRLEYLDQLGRPEEYRLPGPGKVEMFSDAGMIEFVHEDYRVDEYFHVKLTDKGWLISRIEVATHQEGDFVTNRFQALGDRNRDGVLNDEEYADLSEQAHHFFIEPHVASNEVDDFLMKTKTGL